MSSLAERVQRVAVKEVPGTREQAEEEQAVLEDFAVQHGSTYDFRGEGEHYTAQALLGCLVRHRLTSEAWQRTCSGPHLLSALQCVRVLSRDANLHGAFDDDRWHGALAGMLARLGALHLGHPVGAVGARPGSENGDDGDEGSVQEDGVDDQALDAYAADLLVEAVSIVRHLSSSRPLLSRMLSAGVPHRVSVLLSSRDPALVPVALLSLAAMARDSEGHEAVVTQGTVESLLRIVRDYRPELQKLSASLLLGVCKSRRGRALVMDALGAGALLSALPGADAELGHLALRALHALAQDRAGAQELRQTGAVPVLLQHLADARRPPGASLEHLAMEACSACSVLARMAEDLECAYHIRACNGVYVLGRRLLHPVPGAPTGPQGECKWEHRVVLHALRALRAVFSMERNRGVFKALFPPDVFGPFIDVGHFQTDLDRYKPVAERVAAMGDAARQRVEAALEEINLARDGPSRFVKGYEILELLGRGGYGAVFKARRGKEGPLVALKEMPIADNGALFGMGNLTMEQKAAEAGHMCREVEILSKLDHPHIVKYHESFVESDHLYIVMELAEGVSLQDYMTAMRESNRVMSEDDVWQILSAVMLALDYIHNTHKIIHRDLTPANIVLGSGADMLGRAKVTDFGLARELTNTVSVAASMVGTVPYMCPEIIENQAYSGKADVWSLGCILYHMMAGVPPFQGSNPLALASRIVEGDYVPLDRLPRCAAYSADLRELCARMMCPEQGRRPGVREVAALASARMLQALHAARRRELDLEGVLEHERQQRRQTQVIVSRKRDEYQRVARDASPDTAAGANAGADAGAATVADPGGRVRIAGRTVAIASHRLRPIHDPIAQALGALHKLEFVTHLPPGPSRDWRRACLERLRRHLFSLRQHGGSIKAHLVKLSEGSQELLDLPFVADARSGARPPGNVSLSYDGLLAILEEVAAESGFQQRTLTAARASSGFGGKGDG